MTYQEAIQYAKSESERHGCVQHVNAYLAKSYSETEEPTIGGYDVSDWCDDSTVLSYSLGILR